MNNSIIYNVDFLTPLISSVELLVQTELWHNHRSAAVVLKELLAIPDAERYLVTNPEAVKLWSQMIVQFDHTSIVTNGIKNNIIIIPLDIAENESLMAALTANLKVASNALFILEQQNSFLAGLCVKLVLSMRILSDPEFIFSIHPELLYSLIQNEFVYNGDVAPCIDTLFQNGSQLRQYLMDCFSPDLFNLTTTTWNAQWNQLQNLDFSVIDSAGYLFHEADFAFSNDNFMNRITTQFECHYEEELEFYPQHIVN